MYASPFGTEDTDDALETHAKHKRIEELAQMAKKPAAIDFGPSLKGLKRDAWLEKVTDVVDEHGYLQRLGKRHFTTFVEDKSTLLVTFETLQGIDVLSEKSHPLGWEMVKRHRWSHLSVISSGDTWFRDPAVYAYFDRLSDDGFFDEFENVLFYGAGPCGYAAAAFSVAAPGANVLIVQPQATLDPALAEWDARFSDMRRLNFSDRYGYAPDMLDAANQAFVIYDPSQTEDAMHAALFNTPHITKLRLRHMGTALQTDLLDMGVLFDLLEGASAGQLNTSGFASILRARRDYPPYLRKLLGRLEHDGRTELARILCANVTSRMHAPRFERKLIDLEKAS